MRKHKSIEARTLDLRTGRLSFPMLRKSQEEPEEEYRASDIGWLEQAEYRLSIGDELMPEEQARFDELSSKYQDAMSRVDFGQSFEKALPGEGVLQYDEEGIAPGEVPEGDIEGARAREIGQHGADTLRSLLLRQIQGDELTPEEEKLVHTLRPKFPEVFPRLTENQVEFVGAPETPTETQAFPTPGEFAVSIGAPFEGIMAEPPTINSETGEVEIDPEVASEADRYGQGFGDPAKLPEFAVDPTYLNQFRNWVDHLKQDEDLDPALIQSMDPTIRGDHPEWFSRGDTLEKSYKDVAKRTNDISQILRHVPGISFEDVDKYSKQFQTILEEWSKYKPALDTHVSPQFQKVLETVHGMDPFEASKLTSGILNALTYETPLNVRHEQEIDKIVRDRWEDEGTVPLSGADRQKRREETRETAKQWGMPIDLMAMADWIDTRIQNNSPWSKKTIKNVSPEGVQYKIDPPEALVAAYVLMAQSPLPDERKKTLASILQDPNNYYTSKVTGPNLGLSKLDWVQHVLGQWAMIPMGLSDPEGERTFLRKTDKTQQQEAARLRKTYEQLVRNVQQQFPDLDHGGALDYIHNTNAGAELFERVMNEMAGPKIKRIEELSQRAPTKAEQTFLNKQFPYGFAETFLVLSGNPKNTAVLPTTAPRVELSKVEQTGNVLNTLTSLMLTKQSPGNTARIKKLFPGMMTIPVSHKDEEGQISFSYEHRPRWDMSILSDPYALAELQRMIGNEREKGRIYEPSAPVIPQRQGMFKSISKTSLNLTVPDLTMYNGELGFKKRSRDAADIVNMLADITEGLGAGDPLGALRRKFDKGLVRRERDNEFVAPARKLYDDIQSGFVSVQGYSLAVPPQAKSDAKRIMMDQKTHMSEKYEALNDMYTRALQLPEDTLALSAYVRGDTTEIPEAKYVPKSPVPLDTRQAPEEPEEVKEPVASTEPTLQDIPTQREQGKTQFTGDWKPVGHQVDKKDISFTDIPESVTPSPPEEREVDLPTQISHDIFEVGLPEEDIAKNGALSLRHKKPWSLNLRSSKKAQNEGEEIDTDPTDDLLGLSESGQWMLDMYQQADEPTREDFMFPRDPKFRQMENVLRDLQKQPVVFNQALLKYQGGDEPDPFTPGTTRAISGLFDWPIIQEMVDRGLLELTPQQKEEISTLIEDVPETSDVPAIEKPVQEPEEVQEHIALTSEGDQKLQELEQSEDAGARTDPGLYELLKFVETFTIGARNKGADPLRTQQELQDWLSSIDLGDPSYQNAIGQNPTNTQYIDFFKDSSPDEFSPAARPPRTKLVEDTGGMIREMFPRAPISDAAWDRLSGEEQQFLEDLQTPPEMREAPMVSDVYNALLDTMKKLTSPESIPTSTPSQGEEVTPIEEPPTLSPEEEIATKSLDALLEEDKSFLEKRRTIPDPYGDKVLQIQKEIADIEANPAIRVIDDIRPGDTSATEPDRNALETARIHAADIFDKLLNEVQIDPKSDVPFETLLESPVLDEMDREFLTQIMAPPSQIKPFGRNLYNTVQGIAYPEGREDDDTLLAVEEGEPLTPEQQRILMARDILQKGIIPNPDAPRGRHWEQDPTEPPSYFNVDPFTGEGTPEQTRIFQERQDAGVGKKIDTTHRGTLNLQIKQTDTHGPGGPDWWTAHESGPQLNKDKYKKRFPFHNKPSGDLALKGGGEQGNLVNSKPGVQNMDYLEASVDSMVKTADNELFETHNYTSNLGAWLTYTIFKRAYSKFKKGDIVIQYGNVVSEINTFRRRFGTLIGARANVKDAISPIIAALLPGTSTPQDSLHEIQTGPSSGGGNYRKRPDYDHPEGGPREGFKRPVNRRDEDTKRNILPYEDQQTSNQTKIFGEVGNYAAPIVETPEERAGQIEQDLPKPINLDPKRPFPSKRKRVDDVNETTLLDKPTPQRHDKVRQNF